MYYTPERYQQYNASTMYYKDLSQTTCNCNFFHEPISFILVIV